MPAIWGGLLAREIGSALHIPSYIVDPPVVDELAPLARYSGHPLITRRSIFHALNQRPWPSATPRRSASPMSP
mgnify:CR=1 FL=1